MRPVTLSIAVPLYNEEENVRPLVEAVRRSMAGRDDWELVLVDDGSVDRTAEAVAGIAVDDPRVRLVRLARNYGQSAAMQAGFDQSRGAIVVTMDGDLQNDPADILRLVEKLQEGYDLVAGYRESRRDRPLTRKLPSWVANRLIRWVTGVPIRDNGCSLKAYRRELLDALHLYSDMHRFIPALAAGTAGARITEIPVRHHARRFGRSKYGLSRVGKVAVDLLTVKMIRSFRERPLKMFGSGGLAAAFLGLVFAVASMISMALFRPEKAQALVLPGAALAWFGLAFYLAMLGLIAEVALRQERRQNGADLPAVVEDS